jgi:hypothetical protein
MLNTIRRTLILAPASRAKWAVATEADHLEQVYGAQALAWVRQEISAAPRAARARLYRIHDELSRRRLQAPVMHH